MCHVLVAVCAEIGGGVGLNMGKDGVKQMVEAFGGRVTSSISGKTTILLVGKEPGMSKERPWPRTIYIYIYIYII